MDDKIKDTQNALNNLKREEKQIKEEIEKLKGKFEIEEGNLIEPKEVTQYKKELENIQKEIYAKALENAEQVLRQETINKKDEYIEGIENTIYNLEKEEEEIKQEIEKIEGKQEIVNGKIADSKELTEYKKNLGEIQLEISLKKLEKRKQKIIYEKDRLEDENLIEKLKEIYVDIPGATLIINNIIEERKKEINLKLSEIENEILNMSKFESKDIDVDKLIKNMEERQQKNKKILEKEEPEEEKNEKPEIIENEEPEEIVDNNEHELKNQIIEDIEDEIKNQIIEDIDEEIKKIDRSLKEYENLEKEISSLNVEKSEELEEIKSDFKKIRISKYEFSRTKQILEVINELMETNLTQGIREYKSYKNKITENDEKLELFNYDIEELFKRCEKIKEKIIKLEEPEFIKDNNVENEEPEEVVIEEAEVIENEEPEEVVIEEAEVIENEEPEEVVIEEAEVIENEEPEEEVIEEPEIIGNEELAEMDIVEIEKKPSKLKKVVHTVSKGAKGIGKGISKITKIKVFKFLYGLIDKLADKIIPLEENIKEDEEVDDISKTFEEVDEEFDSITGAKKILSFKDRAKSYREEYKVPEDKLEQRKKQKNKQKDKDKNKQPEK